MALEGVLVLSAYLGHWTEAFLDAGRRVEDSVEFALWYFFCHFVVVSRNATFPLRNLLPVQRSRG